MLQFSLNNGALRFARAAAIQAQQQGTCGKEQEREGNGCGSIHEQSTH
jgi:hypothetical protein